MLRGLPITVTENDVSRQEGLCSAQSCCHFVERCITVPPPF